MPEIRKQELRKTRSPRIFIVMAGSELDVQSIWSHAIGSQQMCGLCGCRLVPILARPQEFLQFLRKRRGYAARRRE